MLHRRRPRFFLSIALVGAFALLVSLQSITVAASSDAQSGQAAAIGATTTPEPASTPARAASTPVATSMPVATSTVSAPGTVTATAPITTSVEDESAASAALPSAALAFGGDASALTLADLEDYNGLPAGFTAEGYPFIGDPNAPVTVAEFSDYLCPFCQRHFLQTTPALIDEYVLTGKLRMVFRDFPIPSLHPAAPAGHVAARCVGEAGAAPYWAFHDQLFARQGEWNSSADNAAFFEQVVDELGLDLDAVNDCIAAGSAADFVESEMAFGIAQGFSGTPTFVFTAAGMEQPYTLVGAYPVDEFRAWIDALVSGEEPAAGDAAQPDPAQIDPAQAAQLPYWASEAGLAEDVDVSGYNLAGDATRGSADAPVTIIAFSDFQCPACAYHATEVQSAIDEQLVETGLVRWVFKNRPLAMHPYAPVAAAAAECAAEQGEFWAMHDAIFANLGTWAPGADDAADWTMTDAEAGLLALAADLGLDEDDFSACLGGRAALERVLQDVLDAEGLITSTPSFVVLHDGQGTIVSGTRPAEEFAAMIEAILGTVED